MKLKKSLICSQVAGQTILLDMSADESNDKMVSTNNTGAYIVELLNAGIDEADIIKLLTAKYDVNEATAQKHVQLFLSGLRKLGFLEE